ncbi:MAG: hypothetical protein ACK56I_28595 [bacterium]
MTATLKGVHGPTADVESKVEGNGTIRRTVAARKSVGQALKHIEPKPSTIFMDASGDQGVNFRIVSTDG